MLDGACVRAAGADSMGSLDAVGAAASCDDSDGIGVGAVGIDGGGNTVGAGATVGALATGPSMIVAPGMPPGADAGASGTVGMGMGAAVGIGGSGWNVAVSLSAPRVDAGVRASQASAATRMQTVIAARAYQKARGRPKRRRDSAPGVFPSSMARILISPPVRRDDDIKFGRLEPA